MYKLEALNAFKAMLDAQPHLRDSFNAAVIGTARAALNETDKEFRRPSEALDVIWDSLDVMAKEVIFHL